MTWAWQTPPNTHWKLSQRVGTARRLTTMYLMYLIIINTVFGLPFSAALTHPPSPPTSGDGHEHPWQFAGPSCVGQMWGDELLGTPVVMPQSRT